MNYMDEEIGLKPSEIFTRLKQSIVDNDIESMDNLFSDDAVWEFPLAPTGLKNNIQGRENIVAASRAGIERSRQNGRQITGYESLEIYETQDPEVIIAEFKLHGKLLSSGKSYEIPYIQILRVRNSKIILLKDYFPTEILNIAFGN